MARTEKISFAGAQGDALDARLDFPLGKPRAYALFAHCFACSKDVFAASRVSRALAERGIAVLRFDFTGLGHSEGEFANTNFSSNVEDLIAAAEYLRANHGAPSILVGHSLGGAAVLAAAERVGGVKAVATVGAPFDAAHVARHFKGVAAEIEKQGEAEVSLGGRAFTIRKQFLDDIAEHDQKARIEKLRAALLLFHAPRDEVVGIDNASAIFLAAKHPKSFVSLDDADHLLSRREDAVYVADVLAAWAARYLDPAAKDAEVPAAGEGEVTVAETGEGPYTQIVSVGGRHVMRADEPPSVPGGLDAGPAPYDFLLAGLGACTTMTMRMYAQHKGLPLERARVTLRHAKVHASDCKDCETKEGKLDHIEREIALTGPLSDEQRASILAIAEKCPVHRTLHSEIWIETRLKDEAA